MKETTTTEKKIQAILCQTQPDSKKFGSPQTDLGQVWIGAIWVK